MSLTADHATWEPGCYCKSAQCRECATRRAAEARCACGHVHFAWCDKCGCGAPHDLPRAPAATAAHFACLARIEKLEAALRPFAQAGNAQRFGSTGAVLTVGWDQVEAARALLEAAP